jgi:hypothetical protein
MERAACRRCFTSRYEHVDVGLLDAGDGDGEALELTTGELGDGLLEEVREVALDDDVVEHLAVVLAGEDVADGALDHLGDGIDVLGLDDGLDVVLEQLGQVVLQL